MLVWLIRIMVKWQRRHMLQRPIREERLVHITMTTITQDQTRELRVIRVNVEDSFRVSSRPIINAKQSKHQAHVMLKHGTGALGS